MNVFLTVITIVALVVLLIVYASCVVAGRYSKMEEKNNFEKPIDKQD